MLEEALSAAKSECEKFRKSWPLHDPEVIAISLKAVIAAATRVLTVALLASAAKDKEDMTVFIYHATCDVLGIGKKEIKIYAREGELFQEETFTCPSGCHVLGQSSVQVTVERLLEKGIQPMTVVQNIQNFLNDPMPSFRELQNKDGLMN